MKQVPEDVKVYSSEVKSDCDPEKKSANGEAGACRVEKGDPNHRPMPTPAKNVIHF